MTIIYYVLGTDDGDPCICITPKNFWDQNQCMADNCDEQLYDLLENITLGELCTNMWALKNAGDIWNIIAMAREAGYDLQTDTEFTAFMNRGL